MITITYKKIYLKDSSLGEHDSVKCCWKIVTKLVVTALFVFLATPVFAQTGVGANFGIEADTRSGDVLSGVLTDDWFYNGISGDGVVDEATAISNGYAAQLSAGNNIAFDLSQSIPNYASNSGYIWYSTRYGRDYTNLGSNDLTTFTSGKNGDDPTTSWGVGSGSVPSKTDIVDTGVHMRRDGVNVTDDLWVNMMVSTLSSAGNHFIDFKNRCHNTLCSIFCTANMYLLKLFWTKFLTNSFNRGI